MKVIDIFEKANEASSDIFSISSEKYKLEVGSVTELIDCYRKSMTSNICKNTFDEVINDFFTSILFCLNGMYRNSFISLRCAYEMGLFLIYFQDNNYHFNLWKKNKFDLVWAKLQNEDTGILTLKYLSLYDESNDYQKFLEKVRSFYRETSEFVHGKYEYIESITRNRFNDEITSNFFIAIKSILEVLITFTDIRFRNRPVEHIENINNCYKNMELSIHE